MVSENAINGAKRFFANSSSSSSRSNTKRRKSGGSEALVSRTTGGGGGNGVVENDAHVDVVVVGGGAVGLATACLLRTCMPRSASIALVEPGHHARGSQVGGKTKTTAAAATPPMPELRMPPEARQSTINNASRHALERCGAWAALESVGAAVPVRDMQVHVNASDNTNASEDEAPSLANVFGFALGAASVGGGGQRGSGRGGAVLRWHAGDVGAQTMAHCIENAALVSTLQHAAEDHGVMLAGGLSLEAMSLPEPTDLGGGRDAVLTLARVQQQQQQQQSDAMTESPMTLRARLVVGADGGRSACARLAGLRNSFERDYAQRAVVAVVRTDARTSHGQDDARDDDRSASTAYQVFGHDSEVLAMLPTRGGWRSTVWSVRADRAAALQALSPPAFVKAANEAFGGDRRGSPHVPEITDAVIGASFPLKAHHSGRYTRSRLALVGDAAHSVHPMAGQGANLGIADAVALADAVADAVRSGEDIGDPGVLARYERRRRGANAAMMMAIDALYTSFGVGSGGTAASVRDAGMRALNWFAPIKNEAMMVAMGARGAHEYLFPR